MGKGEKKKICVFLSFSFHYFAPFSFCASFTCAYSNGNGNCSVLFSFGLGFNSSDDNDNGNGGGGPLAL